MKAVPTLFFLLAVVAPLLGSTAAFAPVSPVAFSRTTTSSSTAKYTRMEAKKKYKNMDEILALFPEDMPILINFYDGKTEDAIKNDIFRAKTLLKDRCTVCSIKQQDYPDIAKSWDANEKTPSMILFKDGKPVTRLYGTSFYLDIVAKVGQYCRPEGEEHKAYTK